MLSACLLSEFAHPYWGTVRLLLCVLGQASRRFFALHDLIHHARERSLNAPIPSGAQFGYHPGGWGKPPVDEFGRPIYGDVFGVTDAGNEVSEHPWCHRKLGLRVFMVPSQLHEGFEFGVEMDISLLF